MLEKLDFRIIGVLLYHYLEKNDMTRPDHPAENQIKCYLATDHTNGCGENQICFLVMKRKKECEWPMRPAWRWARSAAAVGR